MPLQTIRRSWRHNPLRRGTDVAEAWMFLVTAVLLVVLPLAAGIMTAGAVNAATRPESHGWKSVSATLTADPPARIGLNSADSAGGRVLATVRWTATNGTVRTGETAVAQGLRAGDRTTAWLDRHGSLVRTPVTSEDAVVQGIAVGVVTASGTALLILGVNRTGSVLLNRRRYAQWEKDWAAADSAWRPRQT
ncbi:hypothetical protein HEK616_28670 [Streptomyces nigrescens]|uniref:Membrane protein SCJ1.26 n=2 Tax=Streptomyces TaxID=1883 RepID=A0ABM7ZSL3_STRNI|nr:hypothetical protein [Streptomyces nigrescens]MEE4418274.1 hypothetical protein [Streptomyces sp. DSM 41528]BDM69380.1 hypothetical protein HEK616_28670 [Streptomyces nigrescens]